MIQRSLKFVVVLTLFALHSPVASYGQEVIFLTRHVNPQKLLRMDAPVTDETPLSETGRGLAMTLAERLKDAGIDAIYSSKTVRTIQTAEPLAKMLGLEINKIPRRDMDGLIRTLREKHPRDRVLVVGHFTTMPGILKRLGHTKRVKIDLPVWNDLFVIVPKANGSPVVTYIHY